MLTSFWIPRFPVTYYRRTMMMYDVWLAAALVYRFTDNCLQLSSVSEESGTPNNRSSGDQHGSTDSLTDVQHSPPPPPPQRRRPSYIYRIADEESPLLGNLGDGNGGGGSEASQARIV
jgi:hypothetical protein